MKNLFLLLVTLSCLICTASAQKSSVKKFGEIDTADLKLTGCDFEKDAHAMVLFDQAVVTASVDSIVVIRHKRIKLFTDYDKDLANFNLSYISYHDIERVSDIKAQTINFENNRIVATPVDPKTIYYRDNDKRGKSIVFPFPEARAGSVIEYSYKWKTLAAVNFPSWAFQETIPVRYSDFEARLSKLRYTILSRGYQPYLIDTTINHPHPDGKDTVITHWAKSNVRAWIDEPFITVNNINVQSLTFQLSGIQSSFGMIKSPFNNWSGIVKYIMQDDDFTDQLDESLAHQDSLIKKAEKLKTADEKIAFLFSAIKKQMKWNQVETWYTSTGVRKAWAKKTGNSAEINLILYLLLKKANIDAYPMLNGSRSYGVIEPDFPRISQVNKLVTFVPIDSTHYYVLDASNKYNTYDQIPPDLLNTYGVQICNIQHKSGFYSADAKTVQLTTQSMAANQILINGEIKADHKVTGNVEVSNYNYQKAIIREIYDKIGEEKYIALLKNNDNRIKVNNLKLENTETDSIPLLQKFNFDIDLTESDDKYIYFSPYLFGFPQTNPFLTENRQSDIDFGTCSSYHISGKYLLPAGYKIDLLPKNVLLNYDNKSITFKRVMMENNGSIELSYAISINRNIFSVKEYPFIREFYKKMYEMLNEAVVLKKS